MIERYKISYVAMILKKSVRTLERYAKKKKIPEFKKDSSGYRYADRADMRIYKQLVS